MVVSIQISLPLCVFWGGGWGFTEQRCACIYMQLIHALNGGQEKNGQIEPVQRVRRCAHMMYAFFHFSSTLRGKFTVGKHLRKWWCCWIVMSCEEPRIWLWYIYVNIYMHMCIHIYIHVIIHEYKSYRCVHICRIYIHIHTCAFRVYTQTHVHTRTHTLFFLSLSFIWAFLFGLCVCLNTN